MQSGKPSIASLISIVGIFLVVTLLLYPAFRRASAREGTPVPPCIKNLKQCAQALKMYTDDYNGMLPSSCLVSHSKRWNTPDFYTFACKAGKIPPDSKMRRVTWAQILYDNMRNRDIMFCPSDTVDKADPSAQTSYWYKLANDKAWYGIGCGAPRRNVRDYGYESDQIAFCERLGWHFNDTKGLRNGVQVNASYLDTHVETITIKNATSGDPINCAVSSDGEPMYYNTRFDEKTGNTTEQTGPATLTDPTCCYDAL